MSYLAEMVGIFTVMHLFFTIVYEGLRKEVSLKESEGERAHGK
jgi:hypothetical protein